MSSSSKLWEAWQLSKTYHCRPSELYGIEHPVQQFYFDRAVWVFGSTVDNEVDKAGEKAKKPKAAEQARLRVLNKWLGAETVGFRAPAGPTR